MQTLLSCHGLRIERKGRPIVDGFSLNLAAGEAALLWGPSGCGKSSVLRAVLGMETPAAGHLEVLGRPVRPMNLRASPGGRGVAALFQAAELLRDRSVMANLRLSAASTEACRGMAREFGLPDDHLHRPARELSGGQQRRVALAMCLLARPRLLVLDEPVAGLDEATIALVTEVLNRHRREDGLAILGVSHRKEFVEALDAAIHTYDGTMGTFVTASGVPLATATPGPTLTPPGTLGAAVQRALPPPPCRPDAFVAGVGRTLRRTVPILSISLFLVGLVFALNGANVLRRFGAVQRLPDGMLPAFATQVAPQLFGLLFATTLGGHYAMKLGLANYLRLPHMLWLLGRRPMGVLASGEFFGSLALAIPLALLSLVAALAGATVGGSSFPELNLYLFLGTFRRQFFTGDLLVLGTKALVFVGFTLTVGNFFGAAEKVELEDIGRDMNRSVVASAVGVITLDALLFPLTQILTR